MNNNAYLVMEGISKNYNGTRALQNVDFSALRGEVHAIIGENGAGKSTLVRILTGAVNSDAGKIYIEGRESKIGNPIDAQRLGIRAVYQHFSLISHLSVTENILIGNMPMNKKSLSINWPRAHENAKNILERIGFTELNVKQIVRNLSVAQKQMVEIAKAISVSPQILIMDEPSAVISQKDLERLFSVIAKLKSENVLILYISHRLDEIFTIADRVTVLKDGKFVGTEKTTNTNRQSLVKMMVGRSIEEIFPDRKPVSENPILKVKNLNRGQITRNINFHLSKGEILGFYGLVGSGRTELARCIFGADKPTSGEIIFNDKNIGFLTPDKAIAEGIAMLTEDRSFDGLIMFLPIKDNASIAAMKRISIAGILNLKLRDNLVSEMIRKLSIRPNDPNKPVKALSGGNQQKVVFAKWLMLETPVLILDEPTRGVDVATKHEIYAIIRKLADSGTAIILISSELPEVIGLSDRVIVMRDGRITGTFIRKDFSEETLLASAAGVKNDMEVING